MRKIRVIFFCFILSLPLALTYASAIEDPFDKPPVVENSRCDRELRFRYDRNTTSVDDFIIFLKSRQYEGNLLDQQPSRNRLIPNRSFLPRSPDAMINLDNLRAKVKILEIADSRLSNKILYQLKLSNADFDDDFPWEINISMSDQGYLSLTYCAGD